MENSPAYTQTDRGYNAYVLCYSMHHKNNTPVLSGFCLLTLWVTSSRIWPDLRTTHNHDVCSYCAFIILAAVPKLTPGEQGDIPVPHFRKRKGESKQAYIHRMTQESEHVLFLTNNQIDRKPEKELKKTQKEQKKHDKQTEEEKRTKKKT